jgi:capsular polysaccharide transport system permease protein
MRLELSRSPADHDRNHAYAHALAQAGRITEAAEHISATSIAFSGDAWLAREAGAWLNRVGRHQEAAFHLVRAAKLEASDAEAFHQLAYACEQLGLGNKAAALAVRAFRLDQNNRHRLLYAAHLLSHIGRVGDAIHILRAAAQTVEPSAAVHRTLSGFLGQAGDYTAALEEIGRALDLEPDHAEYYIHRSGLLFELGRITESSDAIDAALRIDPANWLARRQKVSVLLEGGDITNAVATSAELLRHAPEEEEYASCMLHVLSLRLDPSTSRFDIAERKHHAASRPSLQGSTIWDAAATQGRVISALMLREMRTRFGESRLGYLWALVELGIHIGFLAIVFKFAIQGKPPLGDSFFFFYFTGLIPYLLFIHTSSHVGHAILQNRPLLQLPMVTNLDAILARGLLELITEVAVALMFIAAFVMLGVDAVPHNFGNAAGALAVAWILGLGVGAVNAVVNVYTSAWHHIFSVIQRLLYFCSGIFYVPAMMPESVRDIFSWNPLLHCVDWFRTAFFVGYEPRWLNTSYPTIVALAMLAVGLAVEAALRRRLRQLT